jgi:hypothetical protein
VECFCCGPDNLVFDIDESSIIDGSSLPQIRAATLAKLVERITHEKRINEAALQAFMLTYKYNSLTHHKTLTLYTHTTAHHRIRAATQVCHHYRSFTTDQQLLNLLRARYAVPRPKNDSPQLLQKFIAAKEGPIRQR